MTHDAHQSRRDLGRDAFIGASLVAIAAIVAVLSPERLDPETGQRLVFVAIGVAAAHYANRAAKKLTPLAEMRDDPVTEQSLRRFSAWSLTLGGIGYALAWLLLPISIANVVAVAVLGTTVLLVVTRSILVRRRGRRR